MKEEMNLHKLITSVTLKGDYLKVIFTFPIPLDDTRKLRRYNLKLIIEEKK